MALIKCKECGKDISDTAKVCVNCGAKTEKTKSKNKKIILSLIIFIVILLIILSFVFIHNNDVVVKNKNKAINLLEDCRSGKTSLYILIEELESLSNKLQTLEKQQEDKQKETSLFNLSIQLDYIVWEIKYYKDITNIQIDEYIEEIKKI